MSKKEYDLEQRAEEILKAFAMEMGKNNEKFARAVLDENQPDPPMYVDAEEPLAVESISAESDGETLASQFTPASPHRSRRILRRTLILAAVLVLMMGLVVCTSEGVRLKLSSLFFGDAPGSTRVLDDSNLVVDLEKVELGYVPEGFEVVSDEMFLDIERRIEYRNTDDDSFVLSITKTEQYVYNVDDDRSEQTKCLINDKEGYLFYDGIYNSIIWQIGDITFQLSSEIGKDILIKVAEAVTIN